MVKTDLTDCISIELKGLKDFPKRIDVESVAIDCTVITNYSYSSHCNKKL